MVSLVVVIGLNCGLAILVSGLAYRLWRWRCDLVRLNHKLQNNPPIRQPQQAGLALMETRANIAQTRLAVAQWQRTAGQAQQAFRLLQVLQVLLGYRLSQRSAQSRRRTRGRSHHTNS
jgi:hypothetical protein